MLFDVREVSHSKYLQTPIAFPDVDLVYLSNYFFRSYANERSAAAISTITKFYIVATYINHREFYSKIQIGARTLKYISN